MKIICYCVFSLLIIGAMIGLSTIWAVPAVAQESTPTPTYVAPYIVVTVYPGGSSPDCDAMRTTATPDPNVCTWSSSDSDSNAWAQASLAACIYYTTAFQYTGQAWFDSRCLSSSASAYLKRWPDTVDFENVSVMCSDGGGTANVSDNIDLYPYDLTLPRLWLVGGEASPCNDSYCSGGGGPQTGYAYAELSLESCAPTPTPSATPTVTPGPTATTDPYVSAQSDSCIDISFIYPMATRLTQTNEEITAVGAGIDDEIFSDVTISSDPISMAKGFMVTMSDVSWLKILFGFFIVAAMIILALYAIRFVVAMWGLVERIISLIKLIPFIG